MNRKQKIIISVIGIFVVLLILVGLTYAYFLTRIQGNTNTKSISVTTADLKLTYGDGSGDITAEKIQPGTIIDTKTFTVTNEGNATVNNYAVYLEELVNTLSRTSDMVYTLTCTSSIDGKTCNGKTETTFSTQNGMLVTNNIDVKETQSYELKVVYKEMNVDQSEDMNKTISAKIQIYNLSDIVDITGTVTNASTGDYVEMQSTPKTSQIRDNKYFIPAVEPGVHTLYVKDKNGTVKGSKQITINKGSESSVNGDTITVTSDSQTISLNITSISSALTTDIGDVKDYNPFSDGTLASVIYKSAKKGGENRTTFGTTVTEFTSISGANERVLNNAPDDYGDSYYYRGNVLDNYVTFAGFTWRIIRINGDGSVRLILDDIAKNSSGTVISSEFNSNFDDNAYIGYMYGMTSQTDTNINQCIRMSSDGTKAEVDTAKTTESSCESAGYKWAATPYDATHVNIVSSTIKTLLESWYKTNIVDTNNADYIADTLFCNDKTLAKSTIGSENTAKGYGKNKTFYSTLERLQYIDGVTFTTNIYPSLECAKGATNTYSRFTVNNNKTLKEVSVNNDLTYPVGFITADEMFLAGAYTNKVNKSFYLFNSTLFNSPINSFWYSLSPNYFSGANEAFQYDMRANLGAPYLHRVDNLLNFRPVLNIKNDAVFIGGDGTSSNPYTVKLS